MSSENRRFWLVLCAISLVCVLVVSGCASDPDKGAEQRRLRKASEDAHDELERGRPSSGGKVDVDAPRARSERTESPDPAPSRRRPSWVGKGLAGAYPGTKYLVGMGSATVRRSDIATAMTTAEERARDAIARTIRVRIKTEFQSDAELITEATKGRRATTKDRTAVTEKLSSQVDQVLEGAQIVDRWYDGDSGTQWALSALDRAATGESVLDRMGQIQREIDNDLTIGVEMRKQGKVLPAARRLRRARHSSISMLSYRAQLRAISPKHAKSLPERNDPKHKELWRESALADEAMRLGVVVFAEADGRPRSTGPAEAALTKMLRDVGLNTARTPPTPRGVTYDGMKRDTPEALAQWAGGAVNALVLAHLIARPTGSERLDTVEIHFYTASAEAVVLELDRGTVLASAGFDTSTSARAGKRDPALAARDALGKGADELSALLGAELSKALSSGE